MVAGVLAAGVAAGACARRIEICHAMEVRLREGMVQHMQRRGHLGCLRCGCCGRRCGSGLGSWCLGLHGQFQDTSRKARQDKGASMQMAAGSRGTMHVWRSKLLVDVGSLHR